MTLHLSTRLISHTGHVLLRIYDHKEALQKQLAEAQSDIVQEQARNSLSRNS
jgi:hypothetical protein